MPRTMTMTRAIRLEDHRRFHRSALHMAAAGGLAGLAVSGLALLEPGLGGVTGPLPTAVIAGAALHAAAPPATRARPLDLALVVLAASAAALALAAVQRGSVGPVWGAALFAGALGLVCGRGLHGARMWLCAAAGAAAVLLAQFVLRAVAAAEPGPAWTAAALSGAAFGTVALLGTLPRHLALARPARGGVAGEVEEILARARAVELESQRAPGDPAVCGAIAAEVARLEDVARRWAELERQAASSPDPEMLTARVAELGRRIVDSADPTARAELEKAQGEVAQQLRDVESIRRGRERVLATMHHALAAIERVRLAAVGAEIDCASQALVEAGEIEPTVEGPPAGAEIAEHTTGARPPRTA